jgi:hypothetical protein
MGGALPRSSIRVGGLATSLVNTGGKRSLL